MEDLERKLAEQKAAKEAEQEAAKDAERNNKLVWKRVESERRESGRPYVALGRGSVWLAVRKALRPRSGPGRRLTGFGQLAGSEFLVLGSSRIARFVQPHFFEFATGPADNPFELREHLGYRLRT